jgi:hypothetical protein
MSELENQKPDCRCGHPSTAHSEGPDGRAWTGKAMACVRMGCDCTAYRPVVDKRAT